MNTFIGLIIIVGLMCSMFKLFTDITDKVTENEGNDYYEGEGYYRGVGIKPAGKGDMPEMLSILFKVLEVLYIIIMLVISLLSLGYGIYVLTVGKIGLGILYVVTGLLGGFSLFSFIKSL